MLGWSGIWRASFIYRRYTFWNLNTTWQFAIYGFCLQTQMTLLKSEIENMLNESLPVSTKIYRNLCIDWKVSPELNCCVTFFWDCIVGRVGEVNIKHFIWVQVAMCLLKCCQAPGYLLHTDQVCQWTRRPHGIAFLILMGKISIVLGLRSSTPKHKSFEFIWQQFCLFSIRANEF